MNAFDRLPSSEQLYGTSTPPGPLVERMLRALAHFDDVELLATLGARPEGMTSRCEAAVAVLVDTIADIAAAGYLTVDAGELLVVRLMHNGDRRLR